MANFLPTRGYCYELEGKSVNAAPDDDWEITVYEPTGSEIWVAQRPIDGVTCQVFRCSDGLHRAQQTISCARVQ